MAAFRFRLQAALERARHREEQAALALSELVREREQKGEVLRGAQEEIERGAAELARRQVGEVDLAEVQGWRRHLEEAWAQVEEQRQYLLTLDGRIAAQREELARLRQEREKLERLREGQLAEHRRELLAEEGKVMEELSRLVFSRGERRG